MADSTVSLTEKIILNSARIVEVKRVKKSYPNYYSFEKSDITKLCDELMSKGFSKQEWKVPTNNNFDIGKGVFTTEKYFSLNYNFAAVIAVFENPENKDIIKIMFVNNSSSMKKFNDFTFPSSQSEGPKYYVESSDEIRAIGLAGYMKQLLKLRNRNKGIQYRLASTFNWAALLYVAGYFVGLKYIIENMPSLLPLFSTLLALAIATVFLSAISIKRGIYINSFPHPLLSFIDQMIKGSFVENPITYVFIRLLAVVVTGIIGGFAFSLVQSIFNM